VSKTIQGFARFTIVKANQSIFTSFNNFFVGCRRVAEHFSLIAKVMALTEFLQRGPLSNPVKVRSSIASKDCMDEENVVAHVLTQLLLQDFHVPDTLFC